MSFLHVSGLALAAVDTVPRYHDPNPRLAPASAWRLTCDARVQQITATECPGHMVRFESLLALPNFSRPFPGQDQG